MVFGNLQPAVDADLTDTPHGWVAELDLGFRNQGNRTLMYRRRHRGPLLVQRPFYPPGDTACHVCLLHPPGGLVGGDRLRIGADLSPGARVLLTSPAATKVYRTPGNDVHQNVTLSLCDGAFLEWLPLESLFYDGANAVFTTRIDLSGEATFLGWDMNCLGRPAAGERFRRGRVRMHTEIRRDGDPLWIDRGEFRGLDDSDFLDAPYGLQGNPVTGTVVACAVEWNVPQIVDRLRARLNGTCRAGRIAISGLDSVIVCRYLGDGTRAALETFRELRAVLRPALIGAKAVDSRLWNT